MQVNRNRHNRWRSLDPQAVREKKGRGYPPEAG